jgi:hypothetical protein
MRPLLAIFSGMLLAAVAVAQHGGGGHSGGGHSGGGHSGGGFHGGHDGRGSVGGRGGFGGGFYGGSAGPAIVGGSYVAPYPSYPSYGSGYADPGYYQAPPAPEPQQQMGYAPDYGPGGGQPAPPEDSLQTYNAPAPTPQEEAMQSGHYYLIAYKDHSVYTALAYWMENGVLNYVTPQSVHNQVTLDRVDLDLTKQLNSRRGYPFNIVNQ